MKLLENKKYRDQLVRRMVENTKLLKYFIR